VCNGQRRRRPGGRSTTCIDQRILPSRSAAGRTPEAPIIGRFTPAAQEPASITERRGDCQRERRVETGPPEVTATLPRFTTRDPPCHGRTSKHCHPSPADRQIATSGFTTCLAKATTHPQQA
jgi:hypothetical protein